jgi:hypothetical protein
MSHRTTPDPQSIAHRLRCLTVQAGQVVRCPLCWQTTFEGFEFDGSRDPCHPPRQLVDEQSDEDVEQLLEALLDIGVSVTRRCPRCSVDPY